MLAPEVLQGAFPPGEEESPADVPDQEQVSPLTTSGAAGEEPPGPAAAMLPRCRHGGDSRQLGTELCASWLPSELLKDGPGRGERSPRRASVSTERNWIFAVMKLG